ncbi:GNAT family N-acetyltransferase [Algoriphagus sp. AGSA1]|uniref:GNAT family N-acetyltransferase n=1 Tax=Algoriphagus sp. AGSA1 TaxID=2907213 RepID=UPI001F21FE7A|nr:GNAT family N-acetyltransferase [Algoriphagus sp. AGSA1]MCE7054631.1 GNAT family N-acetyltransferase [Algoriphagus sp. AGSA1]
MNIQIKNFEQLSTQELYVIIRLRNEIFVVEQNCLYQDADNKDLAAYHVMIKSDDALLAYARVLPPGISYPEVSIGRVACDKSARGKGLGQKIMEQSLSFIKSEFGSCTIRIGAQTYLNDFYKSLGFENEGRPYLEDGIEHIEMLKRV